MTDETNRGPLGEEASPASFSSAPADPSVNQNQSANSAFSAPAGSTPRENSYTASYQSGAEPYGRAPSNPYEMRGGEARPYMGYAPRSNPQPQPQPWNNMGGYSSQPYGATPPPPRPPKKKTGLILSITLLYLLLLGGVVALVASGALQGAPVSNPSGEAPGATTEERESYAPIGGVPSTDGNTVIRQDDYDGKALTAAELYERNVNCVVFVSATYRNGVSNGSGFIIDSENGYILTNYHVVDGSADLSISLKNGDTYPAKLVGGDEINDVAVLKVEAKNLPHVTIGDSDKIRVGDDVLIIGNPLGDLTFTMTKGIVSAVDRSISTGEYSIQTFQTDTAINSGNSGGPAFDATGAVIGIASAKYSATGIEGIGFCIPINDAMAIAQDLVAYGYVKGRPNFGVTVSDSIGYEYVWDENGKRVKVETAVGAKIEAIGKNCCAADAGLKVGDIVTKINNIKVESGSALINIKNRYKAGDTVVLEVYRDGETFTVSVTLDEYVP